MTKKEYYEKWGFEKNTEFQTMRTFTDLDQLVDLLKDREQFNKIKEITVKFNV